MGQALFQVQLVSKVNLSFPCTQSSHGTKICANVPTCLAYATLKLHHQRGSLHIQPLQFQPSIVSYHLQPQYHAVYPNMCTLTHILQVLTDISLG